MRFFKITTGEIHHNENRFEHKISGCFVDKHLNSSRATFEQQLSCVDKNQFTIK